MLSHFFIDRPIFASVLSIVITLAGTIAMVSLPINQYPDIAPPSVQVSVVYPGASAQVVADTIAAPIEQQVNGVERMLFMSSQSNNDGTYNLTVTFDLGTDLNTALVMVQNRVSLALPQLPVSVQQQGITLRKRGQTILLIVNFFSPDGRYDDIYLSNWVTINARDELLRLPGMGDIIYMGQRDYSIRYWLDPQELSARNITAGEVADAIRSQNLAVALGQYGSQPAPAVQAVQMPLDALGRLQTIEQFGDVVVKVDSGNANSAARIVRMRDVARVELAAQTYTQSCTLNGSPSVGLAIFQLPGTNALDVAEAVQHKMVELKSRFPEGIDYEIAYDTTPYVTESVHDVVQTLFEAVVLVAIVVLSFLQRWRAALIPLVAVPVAIIGTFAVMAALGFFINTISLFGLVLAIGIVVDDAIVVVENVERWLEEGLSPRDAARKAMDEVTGPIVAVAIVLCAVFVPCAFISGITGQFFRQFAVTIAASTVISAINSLTLSPALAALLLRPHSHGRDWMDWIFTIALGWYFWLFNRLFGLLTAVYNWLLGWLLWLSLPALAGYAGLVWLTWHLLATWPTGFIPQQDQGRLIVNLQLPDAASLQRTSQVMAKIEKMAHEEQGARHTVGVAGNSFISQSTSSNFGSMFIVLDPFDERKSPDLSADAIMARLRARYRREVREAVVSVFGATPVPGIGLAGGFKLMIEDRGALGLTQLEQQASGLIGTLNKTPGILGVMTQFSSNTPQLWMDIDRTKIRAMGVSISDVNTALQVYLGSLYVNSFNAFGRFWQVNLMAEGKFRNHVEAINVIQVRNSQGQMVPLSSLVSLRDYSGPVMINRYNLYPAAPLNGNVAPGVSTGHAFAEIEQIAREKLPRSMATEWTDLAFMQVRAGDTTLSVFSLSVVFVFLALAALYESWSLPLAVILVVPLCILCSIVGLAIGKLPLNIFVQIGLVVLVGLACKNAILIVEFAKLLHSQGRPVREATQEASRLRLRPILMTSLAFILGVVPLVLARGAGAEMRQSLGTAVLSGMLGVTAFGVFLTPVFFLVIQSLSERPQFSGATFLWVASLSFGLGLGLLLGYLAWSLGAPSLRWSLVIGGVLGLAAGLAARQTFVPKRLWRKKP